MVRKVFQLCDVRKLFLETTNPCLLLHVFNVLQKKSLSDFEVVPLTSANDFPYVVIEYFKEEYRSERPSDKMQRMGKRKANEKLRQRYRFLFGHRVTNVWLGDAVTHGGWFFCSYEQVVRGTWVNLGGWRWRFSKRKDTKGYLEKRKNAGTVAFVLEFGVCR